MYAFSWSCFLSLRYSGITEKMLENVTRSLRDVQAVLLTLFNSKTVLVGHSLESDFKALKLIHDKVVDTSVLYPHKMGPPKKRALKTLCIENLKRIIQEDGTHNIICLREIFGICNFYFCYRRRSQQC